MRGPGANAPGGRKKRPVETGPESYSIFRGVATVTSETIMKMEMR
jgi:hypothetical protein